MTGRAKTPGKSGRVERVYVAGPMAERALLNQAEFRKARDLILAEGLMPCIPHDVHPWDHDGDCPGGYTSSADLPHRAACYLRADILAMLVSASDVYVLPGWEFSVGARLEVQVAATCGIPVRFLTQAELDEAMR